MKKVITITLLLSYILPFWGVYAILQLNKYHIKREVKAKIKEGLVEEKITRLVLAKSEADGTIFWRHSKEFEYDGHLYDIIDRYESQDSLYFLVYWDYEETKIKRKLDRLISESSSSSIFGFETDSIFFLSNIAGYFNPYPVFGHLPALKQLKYPPADMCRFNEAELSPATPPPDLNIKNASFYSSKSI